MNLFAALKAWNKQRLVKRREVSLERMVLAQSPDYLILTPPHCLYLAHEMQHILSLHRATSSIGTHESTERLKHLHHIIICPQIFKYIPPSFTAVQLEQSTSSAWFTADYLQTLEKAETILDYSRENIDYLSLTAGLPRDRLRYLPIAFTTQPTAELNRHFEYDVAFYGNTGSNRRQKYLKEISNRFKTLIIESAHGLELISQLKQAKCIVNIHYYEDALLETTRVYECLSNNLMVISETSRDQIEHANLNGIVEFVEAGNINDMIKCIEHTIASEATLLARIGKNTQALETQENRFLTEFEKFIMEKLLKLHPPAALHKVAC